MQTPNLPAIRALRPAWNKGRIVGQKFPLKPLSFSQPFNGIDLGGFQTGVLAMYAYFQKAES